AGVSAVAGSISGDGVYDPVKRQVVWHLPALWPGQEVILQFQADLAPDLAPGALVNLLDMEGYWDWSSGTVDQPEPQHHYYAATSEVTVLPSAGSGDLHLSARVLQGSLVANPQVTVYLNTSPEAQQFFIQEWTWDSLANRWEVAQQSGWIQLQDAAGLSVDTDTQTKIARYAWRLNPKPGAHYLGVWTADEHGQASSLDSNSLVLVNLIPAVPQPLAAGEKVQYRLPIEENDLSVYNLIVTQGTAHLYGWNPRHSFFPDYYSTPQDMGGIRVETLAYYAPESGIYILEIQALNDTLYQFVAMLPDSLVGMSTQAQAVLQVEAKDLSVARQQLAEKAAPVLDRGMQAPTTSLPEKPATFTTPWTFITAPDQPPVIVLWKYYYFPLVNK
ncbi:MAG: hypothetical protein ACKOC5_10145, partial [Chloroflexota bacterium]